MNEETPQILKEKGFILEDGTPVIMRTKVVKGLEKGNHWLKGKLVQKECQHQFKCLEKHLKEQALKVNNFRDQRVPLWRCEKCGGYTWSM